MLFTQFLKSLDDLLYEVMTWLVFYPVTFWKTLRRPRRMMDYARAELSDPDEEQYTDTLSPPLFLLITLLLAHGVELSVIGQSPVVADADGLAGLVGDHTSLLLMRLVILSLFPLTMAVQLVRKLKIGLDRASLKAPFYSQCYAASPFVLTLSLAATFSLSHYSWGEYAALGLGVAAFLWYGILQILWFARHLAVGLPRAFWTATEAMVASIVFGITASAFFD